MCCIKSSIYETLGIRFKRPTVRTDLPSISYDNISLSSSLSKFPVDSNINRLLTFVDAAHAKSPLSIVVPLLVSRSHTTEVLLITSQKLKLSPPLVLLKP